MINGEHSPMVDKLQYILDKMLHYNVLLRIKDLDVSIPGIRSHLIASYNKARSHAISMQQQISDSEAVLLKCTELIKLYPPDDTSYDFVNQNQSRGALDLVFLLTKQIELCDKIIKDTISTQNSEI
jgi:hypothetical protein